MHDTTSEPDVENGRSYEPRSGSARVVTVRGGETPELVGAVASRALVAHRFATTSTNQSATWPAARGQGGPRGQGASLDPLSMRWRRLPRPTLHAPPPRRSRPWPNGREAQVHPSVPARTVPRRTTKRPRGRVCSATITLATSSRAVATRQYGPAGQAWRNPSCNSGRADAEWPRSTSTCPENSRASATPPLTPCLPNRSNASANSSCARSKSPRMAAAKAKLLSE